MKAFASSVFRIFERGFVVDASTPLLSIIMAINMPNPIELVGWCAVLC